MLVSILGKTLRLAEGDITDQQTDAIVNAANEHLILGSGVAGAIRLKGGPSIQKVCYEIGGCPVGDAVITGSGLPAAKYVIHAVGPLGSDSKADLLLASATRRSLEVATECGLRSVAFPAISTGVFGYPTDKCAGIMLGVTMSYLTSAQTSIEEVVFCLYGQVAFDIFVRALQRMSSGDAISFAV